MHDPPEGHQRLRLIGIGLAGVAVVFLAMLAPDLYQLLPHSIREQARPIVLIGTVAGYLAASGLERFDRSRGRDRAGLRLTLDRLDAVAVAGLDGGLAAAAGAIAIVFLAGYIPHYLLWPWSCDADTFAVLARSWDQGIRPYREIHGYNFPGAIYLHWTLGKTFGWGRTWPLYAVDSLGLVTLGVVLAAWSRRCLGGMFPGLASYAFFLTFSLSHSFMTVAERDWHTALLMAIGLMTLQTWPGRASRWISALLAAAALTTRPHTVVFLPAMALAVLNSSPRSQHPTARLLAGRLATWAAMLAGFTVIGFAPLVLDGIAGDLVRGLRVVAYGGPYSQTTPSKIRDVLIEEICEFRNAIVILLLIAVVLTTRGEARKQASIWMVALVGAILYRPFHPVQHFYLNYPNHLFLSIALAQIVPWILAGSRIAPAVRVFVAAGLLIELSLGVPTYFSASGTVRAIAAIARGEEIPRTIPPGAREWFGVERARYYEWKDYRSTLLYLRRSTSRGTQVANMLRQPPYPGVNGSTGRASPFRAESGILWMVLIAMDLEPEFLSELESAGDSVVVWSPGEPEFPGRLRFDRLRRFIRDHYRPEARFGRIEVWRRVQ